MKLVGKPSGVQVAWECEVADHRRSWIDSDLLTKIISAEISTLSALVQSFSKFLISFFISGESYLLGELVMWERYLSELTLKPLVFLAGFPSILRIRVLHPLCFVR